MKTIKATGLVMVLSLILAGCVPDTGNPDLSGSWTCEETSQIYLKGAKGTSVYQVTFGRDAVNQDQYRIDNFYKLGAGIKVIVLKNGYTLTIPKQSVDGFNFEGSGTINESYDLIEMAYTADDGGGVIDHVTAAYSR
jgi:hypothetical protein